MCLHSGKKPYICQCGKGFIRKDHMVKHTETHLKKKVTSNAAQKKAAQNAKLIGKKRESSFSLATDSSDSLQFSLE